MRVTKTVVTEQPQDNSKLVVESVVDFDATLANSSQWPFSHFVELLFTNLFKCAAWQSSMLHQSQLALQLCTCTSNHTCLPSQPFLALPSTALHGKRGMELPWAFAMSSNITQ